MGFDAWLLIGVGILLGQITLVGNLAVWIGFSQIPQHWIYQLIERAVRAGLRECLDLDLTTTSTTTLPFWPVFQLDSDRIFISVRFGLLLSFAILILLISVLFWAYCLAKRGARAITLDDSPVGEGRSETPLAVRARNQLAELRLRHHGSIRAIRSD